MKLDVKFKPNNPKFDVGLKASQASMGVKFDQGVVIREVRQVFSDTTEGWNSQPNFIGLENCIYIYMDHQVTQDEHGNTVFIPGVKVGDGKAYLIDAPFTDEIMVKHMADGTIHVTAEEKIFWNNKVTSYIDADDDETLVLSKL